MGEIPRAEEENNLCPHGANPAECEACLLAQPSWDTIKELQKESEFKRSSETSANCTIELEGKKFTIETIENGEDPALADVQKLFEDTFGEEEVDPEEILRSAVNGVTPWGTQDVKYRIVTIRNEKGELASTFAGAQLDLRNDNGEPTGESAYFVGYAVTNKKLRQKGLAKEAYVSALIDATKEAQSQGKTLKFSIGECTHTSEKFWNSVGWKRIYAKNEDGSKFAELKYIQPALEFDENTGKIADGAGEAPEHLMIDGFGAENPNKDDVSRSYAAFMRYNTNWPAEAFSNPSAHETQKQYVGGIMTEFTNDLNAGGELVFLDAKARSDAKKDGIKIQGHNDADHGETGKEDF